jgi:hypothetical protein
MASAGPLVLAILAIIFAAAVFAIAAGACLLARLRWPILDESWRQLGWRDGGYINPYGPEEDDADGHVVRSVHGIFVRIR